MLFFLIEIELEKLALSSFGAEVRGGKLSRHLFLNMDPSENQAKEMAQGSEPYMYADTDIEILIQR